MINRTQLRRTLRQQRRALPPTHQTRAAFRLFLRLSRHSWIKKAKHIAMYLPADGEISPMYFREWARRVQKQLYLPCINASTNTMTFRHYNETTPLKSNVFGIPEPINQSGEVKHAMQMDVILMPLVGFDREGNRLGMGGGYYDRALANKRKNTKLIGLAHALQQQDKLPTAPWDVGLQLIGTDQGVITPAKIR